MSRDSSSVLKMSIKEIAEDYEKKWVKDEFLYIEDAIEAAIIKFMELRGVAEATDLKAKLCDQVYEEDGETLKPFAKGEQFCRYPECKCPIERGADGGCLQGLPDESGDPEEKK